MLTRFPLGCLLRNPTYLHQAPSSTSQVLLSPSFTHFHTSSPSFVSELGKLRKKTGYSLSICKKALSESNNDVAVAEKWLKDQAQAQGWAKAQKLQGRNTSQGLLGVKIQAQVAAVVELNCETDFVARNKKFEQLLDDISSVCLKENKVSSENDQPLTRINLAGEQVGKMVASKGGSLADLVALNIGQIGENIALGRVTLLQAGEGVRLSGLSHPSSGSGDTEKLQAGRYAALLAYTQQGEVQEGVTVGGLARQICQHIIGMAPTKISDEEDKDNSLLHQNFLLDEDLKVGDILKTSGIEVLDFVRTEVGRDHTTE